MLRSKLGWATGLLCACAVALTACGQSATSGSGASPGVNTKTHTIDIGASAAKTGAYSLFGEGSVAAQAYVDYVNAHGGVNGWKLHYTVLDDQYQPSLAVSDLHQLLASNIFAVAALVGTPTNAADVPILKQAKVPDIGFSMDTGVLAHQGITTPEGLFFGYQVPFDEITAFQVEFLANVLHATKISLAYTQDAPGEGAAPGVPYEVSKLHLTLAANLGYNPNATDFSGYAATLASANAPYLLDFGEPPNVIALLKACAAIGYHPTVVLPFYNAVPAVFQPVSALGDTIYFDSWFTPITDTSNPGVSSMISIVRQYTSDQNPSAQAALGWIGMGVFIHALQLATKGGKTPTRASLIKALETGPAFEPGNLGATLTFSASNVIPTATENMYRYDPSTQTTPHVYGPLPVPRLPVSLAQ
ncbi:MAG: ABC transporter substrate-binding protein [Candidatus Dormibacteraeota bacterium]|nr:ABC transporter substrate-binding protein [Candidatus Dormibacteraeota bacterium]